MGIKSFFKKVGKVALKVAPIAAAFIPGVGPLAAMGISAATNAASKKVSGGSWKDALKSGAIGAATSGIGSGVGNVAKGIGPSAGTIGKVTGKVGTVMDSTGKVVKPSVFGKIGKAAVSAATDGASDGTVKGTNWGGVAKKGLEAVGNMRSKTPTTGLAPSPGVVNQQTSGYDPYNQRMPNLAYALQRGKRQGRQTIEPQFRRPTAQSLRREARNA